MNKDLLCDSSNSLLEVMRIINKNGKGVCFVIDESKSLKGVVTDGDIRRALLDSIHLDEKVENILSKDFCYGNIDEHYDSLIAKISDEVNIIPLVNNKLEAPFSYTIGTQYLTITRPITLVSPELFGPSIYSTVYCFINNSFNFFALCEFDSS